MKSFNSKKLALGLAFASFAVAAFAGVNINGDAVQEAELKNSPVSALAMGKGAEAEAKANKVKGNVTIKGNLKQKVTAKNSPISALAVGEGAQASAVVNEIEGF